MAGPDIICAGKTKDAEEVLKVCVGIIIAPQSSIVELRETM